MVGAVSLRASFERIAGCAQQGTYGSFREHLIAGYATMIEHESTLLKKLCAGFADLQNKGVVQVLGTLNPDNRIGVFSRYSAKG
jgi:hypothetical protein